VLEEIMEGGLRWGGGGGPVVVVVVGRVQLRRMHCFATSSLNNGCLVLTLDTLFLLKCHVSNNIFNAKIL
jgi:hypothetical protein